MREDNPARDVEGPDRGAERSGPYFFPREFELLMASERVPVRWKRVFALTTCLYLRGGELAALAWNSVNSTKTKDVRKVPIEPAIVPLLEEVHRDPAGEGLVVTACPPRSTG